MSNRKFSVNSFGASSNSLSFLGSRRRKIIFVTLTLLVLAFALSVRSYFSADKGILGNNVAMATLDLEVTEENGSTLMPFDFGDIYPGWDHEMRGKIKNVGSADLIFRTQVQGDAADFESLAKTILYDLRIENEFGVMVYSQNGHLDNLNSDNCLMNIAINPDDFFVYSLSLNIPVDMDDYTTPENENDNQYQGKNAQFDFVVQSTQADNTSWTGLLTGAIFLHQA